MSIEIQKLENESKLRGFSDKTIKPYVYPASKFSKH